MSGLSLRLMMLRAWSICSVVFSRGGAASSAVQPSSKSSWIRDSNRPVALDWAPRPRGEGEETMAATLEGQSEQNKNY